MKEYSIIVTKLSGPADRQTQRRIETVKVFHSAFAGGSASSCPTSAAALRGRGDSALLGLCAPPRAGALVAANVPGEEARVNYTHSLWIFPRNRGQLATGYQAYQITTAASTQDRCTLIEADTVFGMAKCQSCEVHWGSICHGNPNIARAQRCKH